MDTSSGLIRGLLRNKVASRSMIRSYCGRRTFFKGAERFFRPDLASDLVPIRSLSASFPPDACVASKEELRHTDRIRQGRFHSRKNAFITDADIDEAHTETMAWQRLIRFEDDAGRQHFGEPLIANADELQSLLESGSLKAKVLAGDGPFSLSATGEECKVKTLLGVLQPADVPIIKCIGLNYMKHSKSSLIQGLR